MELQYFLSPRPMGYVTATRALRIWGNLVMVGEVKEDVLADLSAHVAVASHLDDGVEVRLLLLLTSPLLICKLLFKPLSDVGGKVGFCDLQNRQLSGLHAF